MNSSLRPVLLPILTFVFLILAWQMITVGFQVPEFLLPRPTSIIAAALRLGWPLLTVHAAATLETILLGFIISALVAVPLGVMLAANKLASEALYPLLIFTHAIPVIAIAPIVVVSVGTGLNARLIVVTLISFFPIMVSTATGILNAPGDMLDLGRTVGASKWQRIATIAFPHAIPFIFNGFRIGIVGSVIGAVVGEFVSANSGLGYLVVRSTSDFDVPAAMVCVIILAIISVTLYQLTTIVQALISPWAPHGRE